MTPHAPGEFQMTAIPGEHCSYHGCTAEGHSVCDAFFEWFEEIKTHAEIVVSDPSEENLVALKAVLDEEGKWK